MFTFFRFIDRFLRCAYGIDIRGDFGGAIVRFTPAVSLDPRFLLA